MSLISVNIQKLILIHLCMVCGTHIAIYNIAAAYIIMMPEKHSTGGIL